jgi:hypothetical protein
MTTLMRLLLPYEQPLLFRESHHLTHDIYGMILNFMEMMRYSLLTHPTKKRLKGSDRVIKKIDFWYETKSLGHKWALVKVYRVR